MKEKETSIQKIEEQIQGWKVDIDRLRAMAENAEAQMQTEYHRAVPEQFWRKDLAGEISGSGKGWSGWPLQGYYCDPGTRPPGG